jgi:hypothetical protein
MKAPYGQRTLTRSGRALLRRTPVAEVWPLGGTPSEIRRGSGIAGLPGVIQARSKLRCPGAIGQLPRNAHIPETPFSGSWPLTDLIARGAAG